MAEDNEGKPFEVNDRRRFDAAGNAAPDAEGDARPPAVEPAKVEAGALPPIDLSTLVLSLSSSAIFHLGEIPHPETGKPERNLPLAKQTIDLLALLQDKTRGNRTQEESDLLESLLYELRMKYVQAVR